MKMYDYITLGWDQLKRRKVVTALCALGIAIGSASIIVALAFGESVAHYSEKQMNYYLKTDEITIFGGGPGSSPEDGGASEYDITQQKLNLIRSFPHVKTLASYENLGGFSFTVDDTKKGDLSVVATDLDTLAEFGSEFQQGAPSDLDNTIIVSYPATLGIRDEQAARAEAAKARQARDQRDRNRFTETDLISYPLYQKQIRLERIIPIGNGGTKKLEFPVRVVGVLKKPEGLPDDRLRYEEHTAYISRSLAKRIRDEIAAASPQTAADRSTEGDKIQQVKVKIDKAEFVAETESLIQKLKLNTVSSVRQQENMQQEFVILRLVFGGIGLFVLFVASISIIVAMTMSTYQRRRQIGIMKVLGANLRQIRNMFVVESALLGFLGGLLGILLSYWVIWGINILVIRFSGVRPGSDPEILFISLWILPLGMFFALLTGVLSGIFPAIKASRTDALTAIKRE